MSGRGSARKRIEEYRANFGVILELYKNLDRVRERLAAAEMRLRAGAAEYAKRNAPGDTVS